MPKQTFSLGRGANSDLVLSRHSSVSRKHLRLAVKKGACQMTVVGNAGTQLLGNRTLSTLMHREKVSLKGVGMIQCGGGKKRSSHLGIRDEQGRYGRGGYN